MLVMNCNPVQSMQLTAACTLQALRRGLSRGLRAGAAEFPPGPRYKKTLHLVCVMNCFLSCSL